MGCNKQFPRKADAMRSHEMKRDPALKSDGTGMTSREIVAAKHRRLGHILLGTFFVPLYGL